MKTKIILTTFLPGLFGLLFAMADAHASSWTQIGCSSASDGKPKWTQLNQNQGSSGGTTWTKLDGGCPIPQAQAAAVYHHPIQLNPPPPPTGCTGSSCTNVNTPIVNQPVIGITRVGGGIGGGRGGYGNTLSINVNGQNIYLTGISLATVNLVASGQSGLQIKFLNTNGYFGAITKPTGGMTGRQLASYNAQPPWVKARYQAQAAAAAAAAAAAHAQAVAQAQASIQAAIARAQAAAASF